MGDKLKPEIVDIILYKKTLKLIITPTTKRENFKVCKVSQPIRFSYETS